MVITPREMKRHDFNGLAGWQTLFPENGWLIVNHEEEREKSADEEQSRSKKPKQEELELNLHGGTETWEWSNAMLSGASDGKHPFEHLVGA